MNHPILYRSRRSPVLTLGGVAGTSQPAATQACIEVLERGGTAADAAIAGAAALQVTQACSTGLGGDAFALYYDAATRRVFALNGSGGAPKALTFDLAAEVAVRDGSPAHSGGARIPPHHPYAVTVPGAPAAWDALLSRFGRLSREAVLAPAIALAETGVPVGVLTAGWWNAGYERLLKTRRFGHELIGPLKRGPRPGDTLTLPTTADSLRAFAEEGCEPFYRGRIARAIVEEVRHEGGLLTEGDLHTYEPEWVEAISLRFHDRTVWECPPNGQGLAALIALGVYERAATAAAHDARATERSAGLGANRTDAATLHLLVEAMRVGFVEASRVVGDPRFATTDPREALAAATLDAWAQRLHTDRRLNLDRPIEQSPGSDTVYFAVVDGEGNACSFINSNYTGFGSGIVPRGCGFSLQNRGLGFVVHPNHPNAPAPGKRPYHTIIPGLMTAGDLPTAGNRTPDGPRGDSDGDGALLATFGVMGGMMQPQGHLQVVRSLVECDDDPQTALDRPRFSITGGRQDDTVEVEDGTPAESVEGLRLRGHRVRVIAGAERSGFGLGQAIVVGEGGVRWAGSDGRGDGCALAVRPWTRQTCRT